MRPTVIMLDTALWLQHLKSVRANATFPFLGALLCLLSLSPAYAESESSGAKPVDQASSGDDAATLPTVTVRGYGISVPKSELSDDPTANPASVSVLDYSEERKRVVREYADLLKPAMGVSSNSFGQGGVGYGLTLRGFSSRFSGSMTAISIDGVPVNQPSHQLSNGYGYLQHLIPELADRFVLIRGPFDVRTGANQLAGSLHITTSDHVPTQASLAAGSFSYGRALGVYSFGSGEMTGYGSLIASATDGYRDNNDFDYVNTFNKFVFPLADGAASVRLQIYRDEYGAPGYINKTFVENGTYAETTAVNPEDGGTNDLQNIVFNYKQRGDEPITANAYILHSEADRFSSRTNTFINSIQAEQTDKRVVVGGAVEKYYRRKLQNGVGVDWFVGAGSHVHDVDSGRFNTTARVRTSTVENSEYKLINPFVYGQASIKPTSWLKLTGGARYDYLDFDIKDHVRQKSVKADLGVTQPKAGIVVSPIKELDFYANYGRGFRPPNAIGGAELVADPNAPEAEIETKEFGFDYNSADGAWYFHADVYKTTFSDELQGNPPNPPISLGPSTRSGYDLETRARVYQSVGRVFAVFANYSKMTELKLAAGGVIPDTPQYFFKYGFDLTSPLPAHPAHAITFSASQVFEGPKALNTSGTIKTERFSRIDATLGYTNRNWKGFRAFMGFIVYPDKRLEETAFLFSGQVGVSPKPRRTMTGGVSYSF